jgi:ATP-dependent DNA ligase
MKLSKAKVGIPLLPVPDSGPYQLEPARCKTKLTPEEAIEQFPYTPDDQSQTFVGQQKFDGIRYLWQIRPGYVKKNFLTSRRISKVTGKFVQKEDKMPVFRDVHLPLLKGCVFDGEIAGGNLSSDTQHEMSEGRGTYHVWDILIDRGRDIRKLPLWARQEILVDRLGRELPSEIAERVEIVESYADLVSLNESMQESDAEGFVVKKLDAPYGEGWIKVPYDGFLEDCVIIGYEPSLEGKYANKGWIGAITVGQWVPQWFANTLKTKPVKLTKSGLALIEVGTCSGFNDKIREKLSNPVEQARHKYLAIEIKYKMRFEKTGRFRHIRFSRFRHDKNASECIWTPKKPVK